MYLEVQRLGRLGLGALSLILSLSPSPYPGVSLIKLESFTSFNQKTCTCPSRCPTASQFPAGENCRAVTSLGSLKRCLISCGQEVSTGKIWRCPKCGYPQIIHSNRIFHCKPSIWGYPHLWKPPYCTIVWVDPFKPQKMLKIRALKIWVMKQLIPPNIRGGPIIPISWDWKWEKRKNNYETTIV